MNATFIGNARRNGNNRFPSKIFIGDVTAVVWLANNAKFKLWPKLGNFQ